MKAKSIKGKTAREIEEVLKKRGARTTTLFDATREAMLDRLQSVSSTIHADENFIFVFSGHSYESPDSTIFAPSDFDPQRSFASGINAETLKSFVANIASKRNIVILDAGAPRELMKRL